MVEPIRVLIVDDQPRARKSVRALLSTWQRVGEMYEAGNGREAVQLAREFQPDVVLMDMRMPDSFEGVNAAFFCHSLRSGRLSSTIRNCTACRCPHSC